MAQGIHEGLWMKIILDDLKVKYEGLIKLFCDNKSVISIAHNPVQHDRTKHIEIDKHFIKEKLDSGLIVTTHVPTRLQVADVFTKGLPVTRFKNLMTKQEKLTLRLGNEEIDFKALDIFDREILGNYLDTRSLSLNPKPWLLSLSLGRKFSFGTLIKLEHP
ncbi:Copia protein, partial [Mucuna pruriens]